MQEITDDMGLFITVSTVQLSVPRPAYAILVYSGSLFIIHGTSRKIAVNSPSYYTSTMISLDNLTQPGCLRSYRFTFFHHLQPA